MNELLVIAVSVVFALAAIAFLRWVARQYAMGKASDAERVLMKATGKSFSFVYAFGNTAIGFVPDGSVWQLKKDDVSEIEPETVSAWYAGPVTSAIGITAVGTTVAAALGHLDTAARTAARTPSPRYVIIDDLNGQNLLYMGLVDDTAEDAITPFLEAAFPGKGHYAVDD